MTSAQFDEVVEGVTILPSQWCDRMRPGGLSPEQALLCHVLIDGIQCYQGAELRLHLEAERWLFDDREALLSFVDVCQALDIDPAAIRKALLAWRASGRKPVKIERTVRHSSAARPTADRIRKDLVIA